MPELLRPFSESQLAVLAAFANAVVSPTSGPALDAVIAAIPAHASPKQREYGTLARPCLIFTPLISPFPAIKLANSKFTDYDGAIDALATQYATALSPAALAEICMLLSLLSTTAGTTLLTGHLKPITEVRFIASRRCYD